MMDEDAFDPMHCEGNCVFLPYLDLVCDEVIGIMSDQELYSEIFTHLSTQWHQLKASRLGSIVEFHRVPDWALLSTIYLLGFTSVSSPVPTLPAFQEPTMSLSVPVVPELEPEADLEVDDYEENLEEDPIDVEGDPIDS